jgi:hypothetical protein
MFAVWKQSTRSFPAILGKNWPIFTGNQALVAVTRSVKVNKRLRGGSEMLPLGTTLCVLARETCEAGFRVGCR